ncbi:hypothetical protein NJB18091_16530 [Mycobacterium marinum]|uniref:Uncharacterized protein n=1 Tax=Mycobacterium pseudoshottsii TaxID=265949 RepID=A0A9N7LVQ1_9MYCO|nr:hypothetical protein MPSD_41060 [Mycobacterium pseudoshottsii JCM 15466]BDN83857.1 hypothetical protein NJB1907Z4_C40720 [Mycobacterium pseudoshottsii]GJO40539.1 hypothetical protein NJB1604_11160 [Mycobacterium marinum]GJP28906.1 hypothetical protein NJB18091_16530 [Mycobacterium marinum]
MLVAASAEHDGNPETFATPAAATHNLERLPGAERPGRTTRTNQGNRAAPTERV